MRASLCRDPGVLPDMTVFVPFVVVTQTVHPIVLNVLKSSPFFESNPPYE